MKKYILLPFILLLANRVIGNNTPVYVCAGGNDTILASSSAFIPMYYMWDGPGVDSLSGTDIQNPVFHAGQSPGQYILMCSMTDDLSHYEIDTFTVFVCATSNIHLAVVNDTLCNHSQAVLIASWMGGNPSCKIQLQVHVNNVWNNIGSGSAMLQYCDGTSQQYFYTDTLSSGTYWYRVIDSCSQGCGINISDTVTVTVLANPVGNTLDTIVCNNQTFNYHPTANNSNVHFQWTDQTGTAIHNGDIASFVTHPGSDTNNLLYTFHVTPFIDQYNCSGNVFDVHLQIRPTPQGNPSSAIACYSNKVPINVSPTGNMANLNFSWSRNNPAPVIAGTGPIVDTLVNSTLAPLTYEYVVIPSFSTSPNCLGPPFPVNYTLFPQLVGNPYSTNQCTGSAINYHPTSNLPDSLVTYSWLRTNPASVTYHTGNIVDSFVNNTLAPVTYTYSVTPSFILAPQCSGTPQTISVTVQPTLTGTPYNGSVCSGTPINLPPTSNFASGVNYTWTRTLPSPAITGNGPIVDVLTNSSLTPVNYTYSIQPSFIASPQCAGQSFQASYTVNPLPVGNDTVYNYCAGDQGSIPLIANPASTFTWQGDNGTSGASSQIAVTTSTSWLAETTYNYQINPTSANGCVGNPFHIQTQIHPLPVTPLYDVWETALCLSSGGVILSIHPQPGYTYLWNFNPNVSVSYLDDTLAAFTAPSSGTTLSVNIHSTITTTGCSRDFSRDISLANAAPPAGDILLAHGNDLIYMDNAVTGYQWGYDDVTLHPTSLIGETYQDYIAGTSFDTINRFYWVIVTGENGCTNKIYYNLPYFLSVNDLVANTEFTISPNPSGTGWFKISSSVHGEQNIVLTIYDTEGKLIKQTTDKTFYLNNGIYLAAISTGKGEKKLFTRLIVSAK